ncbi:MAG: hypothetical protein Kow0027_07800 [Saprospiraceae bacterium]
MIRNSHRILGHKASIYALCRGMRPGEFFTSGGDGLLVRWSLDNPDEGVAVANAGIQIFSIAAVPEKNLVLAGDMNGGLHWIDLADAQNIRSETAHSCGVFSILPLDDRLLTGGGKGKLNVWSLEKGELISSLPVTNTSIRAIAFSSLRNEVALACSDNCIYLLDAETLEVRQVISQAHNSSVFALAYTRSGQVLYSGGRDALLNAWQLEPEPQLLKSVPAHNYTINALQLICEEKYLVTASRDKTLKVWDSESLELLKVLETVRDDGHRHSVNRLLWMEEFDKLVSVSDDRSGIIWELG